LHIDVLSRKVKLETLQEGLDTYGPFRTFLRDRTVSKVTRYLLQSAQGNRVFLEDPSALKDFSISRVVELGNTLCSLFHVVNDRIGLGAEAGADLVLKDPLKGLGFVKHVRSSNKLARNELRICDDGGNLAFGADYYSKGDFYSMYWENTLTADEFCERISDTICAAEERTGRALDGDSSSILAIDVAGDKHRLPLELPLGPVKLEKGKTGRRPILLRIDTDLGSFCGEFLSPQRKGLAKMGVIWKKVDLEILKGLMQGTCLHPPLLLALNMDIIEEMSNFASDGMDGSGGYSSKGLSSDPCQR